MVQASLTVTPKNQSPAKELGVLSCDIIDSQNSCVHTETHLFKYDFKLPNYLPNVFLVCFYSCLFVFFILVLKVVCHSSDYKKHLISIWTG